MTLAQRLLLIAAIATGAVLLSGAIGLLPTMAMLAGILGAWAGSCALTAIRGKE